jgi:ribosome-binding protein aMBF1 (putative translation factor)
MIDECFRCGVSGERVRLHDAISNHGIVKVCSDCAKIEGIPVINKPTENQIKEAQRHRTVHERLYGTEKSLIPRETNTLRDLVDQKFKNRGIQNHPDLIDNFHWKIQQVKRAKRITREEFAKGIGESDATVRMIEQGFLPANDYKIINKVESFLGVNLRKNGTSGFPDTSLPNKFSLDASAKESEKKLAFDSESTKNLKIEDLKEMDKKVDKNQKGLFSFFKRKEEKKEDADSDGEYSQDDEKFLDENFDEEQ